MILDNLPSLKDRTALLVPDDGALLALAEYGADALDWLFLSGAAVFVTDAVRREIVRDRNPGEDDYAPRQRPLLAHWFGQNAGRIRVLPSRQGAAYDHDMAQWERGGHSGPAPSWDWDDQPRAADAVRAAQRIPEEANARVLVVANHDATRAALHHLLSETLALTGTTRFIGMIAGTFGVEKALSIVSRDLAA
jgi:hypothetical protein